MIDELDFESLLNTGVWTTSRAKGPSVPARANQSAKLVRPESTQSKIPTSLATLSHLQYPPPPIVEDEEASLGRELNGSVTSSSDEEPKCRGTVDQFPILLPVPEFNAERRFVLVPPHDPNETPSEGSESPASDSCNKSPSNTNTKGPLSPKAPPELRLRRSRTDLPRIQTDVDQTDHPRPSAHFHRSRSATDVNQKAQEAAQDYFSLHPESTQHVRNGFLSPASFKPMTKGRERPYLSVASHGTHSHGDSPHRRFNIEEHRSKLGHSRSSSDHRRIPSDSDLSRRPTDRHSSYQDEAHCRSRREPPSSPSERRHSPPRVARTGSSPTLFHADSPSSHRKRQSYHGRSSPPREPEPDHSSDDYLGFKAERSRGEPKKSTLSHENRHPSTSSPAGPRPMTTFKSKPRLTSPLPSTRVFDEQYSSRRPPLDPRPSTPALNTPRDRRCVEGDRPISPRDSDGAPSLRSLPRAKHQELVSEIERPRAPSRTPSTRSQARLSDPPSYSVVSYRRYSEDVNNGALPGLPDCPRQLPRSGAEDWWTLPKHDNFNICPSCYDKVFRQTEFRHEFVYLNRGRDASKEITCDLGTSPWYRIAWLMTRKYGRSDLRLIQGIADMTAKHRVPCYGPAKLTRNWFSITDPTTRRCIPYFTICSPCVEAIQVLFPSLTGIFIPQNRHSEPKPGVCSLHFAPNRNRFLLYFDLLESSHDHAVIHQSIPDATRLADGIRKWSEIEECPGDMPLRNEPWYIPSSIPELTICEECYTEVVVPELVADAEAMARTHNGPLQGHNEVIRNFYRKPQVIRSETICQMSNPDIRDLFRKACRRKDGVEYLDFKVRQKLAYV
ncbi:hypothetical protein BD289DRAFT_144681 [Coniella lustricola]|uniref:Uncharacterized protein n=1 Tax=Coniella lustricola TaxID=2025994 RepID=A0A2T3AF00_9PEZI|nr:hypothetical protein BD289DRAFT_144681 [Coniella lustricola]